MSQTLPPSAKQGSKATLARKNKNNKKKPKKKQQKMVVVQPQMKQQAARVERFHLSPCADSYLRCLTNPFNVKAGVACIPDLIDIPSFKCLAIMRGTMNIGTQGVGFVFCNPRSGSNDITTNVRTTIATFAGTTVATGAGTSSFSVAMLPFTNAQLTRAGVLHRTVGCGLRIRYTGTELNRAGRIVPYRSNAVGVSLIAGNGVQNFLSRPEVPSLPCDRQWHCITYLPTTSFAAAASANQDTYAYADGQATESIGAIDYANGDLGFFVDGAGTTGNGFEWEMYLHKEYISGNGTLVPAGMSASHSDVTGLSAIRDALEAQEPTSEGPSYYAQTRDYIRSWTPQDLSHVSSYLTAGKTVLSTVSGLI